MRVRFYGTLRHIVGASEVETEHRLNDTVRDVLHELLARYPALGKGFLDDAGNLQLQVNIFVRGRNISFLDGLDTTFGDTDDLAIFPPVAGG